MFKTFIYLLFHCNLFSFGSNVHSTGMLVIVTYSVSQDKSGSNYLGGNVKCSVTFLSLLIVAAHCFNCFGFIFNHF